MLTFLKSERAIDWLRWVVAFVAVVLVYGIAGWMLLRPTGWQLGVNGPVVEIDLRDLPQPSAIPPSDRASEPASPANPPRDAQSEPPGAADTASRAAGGSANRADAGDAAKDAVDAKVGSPDANTAALDKAEKPAIAQPGPAANAAPEALPKTEASAPGSGGGGRLTATPPRGATTDTPIDTSITVNQGRSLLRSAKGGPQLKGLPLPQLPPLKLALPTPNRNELFTNFLTKRPSSIVGLTLPTPVVTAPAANQGRAQDLAQKPAMGADGGAMRNAVGVVIESQQPAVVPRAGAALGVHPRAGAPLGIHPFPGAMSTAMHAPSEHSPARTAAGAPVAASNASAHDGRLSTGAANQSQAGHLDRAAEANHLASTGGPAVNGAGLSRPAFSTHAVGGPAHAVAGALNGSSFRPK